MRKVGFEEVIIAIREGYLLDDYIHSNQEKYPNQRILVVKIKEYAFLVPYIETPQEIFLKTIIPSRKATKYYIRRRANE